MNEPWEGVVPSHGFSFSIEVNYNKGYFMDTKCMFSIVSPGYENKFILMSKSFRKYNNDWDIVCFTVGNLHIPGVTTVDITSEDYQCQWSNFPDYYSVRDKVWGYRCFATYRVLCEYGYHKALYCDSDLYFYNIVPDVDYTWFTKHLNYALSERALIRYVKDGFINSGFYQCIDEKQIIDFLLLANTIHHKGFLENLNAVAGHTGNLWDQIMFNNLPWICPDAYRLNMNDGLNVSTWNLHERDLQQHNGIWYANKDPLVCIHYSRIGGRVWAGFQTCFPELYTNYTKELV